MKINLFAIIFSSLLIITACSGNVAETLTPTQPAPAPLSSATPEMTLPPQAATPTAPAPQSTPVEAPLPVSLVAPQFNTIPLGESTTLTNEAGVSYTFRIKTVYIGQKASEKILRANLAEELQLVIVIPEIVYVHGPANQRAQLMHEESFQIISNGHLLENDFSKYTPPSNHLNQISLLPGETSQGYLVFGIYKNDAHPILRYVNQGQLYFFDLTKTTSPDLSTPINPLQFGSNGLGQLDQPVPLGKTILYQWQNTTLLISVERMERGMDAVKRLWNLGETNLTQQQGREYVLPYLHVQVLKSTGDPTVIDPTLFQVYNPADPAAGASPVACPMPCLHSLSLYQGGDAQGWLPRVAATSDSLPILEFNHELYFSLTETGAPQTTNQSQTILPTLSPDAIGYNTIKQVGLAAQLQQKSPVQSLAFSPDNSLLASGSDDRKVHIWDVHTASEIKTLQAHKSGVKYISFSADGKWMVSVSQDEDVIVWNVADWQIVQQLKQDGRGLFAEFLADNTLISVNQAGLILQWDVNTATILNKFRTQKNITPACSDSTLYGFDMTPDGKTFAAALACGYGVVWNPATDERLVTDLNHAYDTRLNMYTGAISLSHIGGLAAYGATCYPNKLYLVDIADIDRQMVLGGVGTATANIPAIAFSPNGQLVAVAIGPLVRAWWPNGYIWSGRGSLDLKGNSAQVTALKFSPDAAWLASGDYKGNILLWTVNAK